MMFRALLAVIAVSVMGACAGPRRYGVFVEHPQEQALSFYAIDAAAQLRRAYTPTVTTLSLPDASDHFGRELVVRLRRLGFAVAEEGVVSSHNALTVRYVVDAIEPPFHRLMLVIWRSRDAVLVSRMLRAYRATKGDPHPAGAWTRQTPAQEAAWTTN